MKFEKLRPGMIVYDVGRHKMGNTTISTVAVWPVQIIEVIADRVMARWNGNAPRVFYKGAVAKWRETKPMTVETFFGAKRLANREEIKAAKADAAGEKA